MFISYPSGRSRPTDKGGGGGHLDPEVRGSPGLKKIIFRPFGPQFGLKVRGAGPPGPSSGSATVSYYTEQLFVSPRKAVRYHSFTTTFTASEKSEIPIDDILN